MSSLHTFLLSQLEEVTGSLRGVSARRMFGCDALFADGAIFALIWKTGRIGLKLPDAALYAALLAEPGTEPWAPGEGKPMAHWLLVPESLHDDLDALAPWVQHAHKLALQAGPPVKKPARAGKKAAGGGAGAGEAEAEAEAETESAGAGEKAGKKTAAPRARRSVNSRA